MPNLPGLTPDDAPSLTIRSSGGRVVPRDTTPDPERLQPVAAPVDTYVRPVQPRQDTTLTRLADSLSAFNPALERFGSVQAEQDHSELPGKIMAAKLSSKDDAEFQDKLHADPDLQSPFAQRLGMKQLGISAADTARTALVQDYETSFDKTHGDFNQFMADRARADLEAHKGDPSFAAGYAEVFRSTKALLQNNLTQYRTTQAADAQNQQITGASLGLINAGSDISQDPAKTVSAIQDQFRTNEIVLKKSPQDQDKLQASIIDNLKDKIASDPTRAGYYNAIIAGLANADRTGLDGKSRGSLLNDPIVGGKVADVVRGASSANQTQSNLQHEGDITRLTEMARTGDPSFADELTAQRTADPKRYDQQQITSLTVAHDRAVAQAQVRLQRQQQAAGAVQADANVTTQALVAGNAGQLHMLEPHEIPSADGKMKVVSVDDQIANATAAKLQQIKSYELKTGDTQGAFAQKVKWFADNPSATNNDWKRQLRSGLPAITTNVAGGGPTPKAAHDAYQLYKNLDASAPGIAYSLTDEKSRDFYERAKVNEQFLGKNEADALALAARSVTDKTFGQDAPTISRPKFDQGAKSRLSQWFGTDVTATVNQAEVYNAMYAAADNLVRGNHLQWDDAMDIAAAGVKKQFTVINGVAVKTADKRVPGDFGAVANRYFDNYWDLHKDELTKLGLDRDHLSMAAVGTGNAWRIVRTPMMADPGIPDATVTLGDLYGASKSLDDEKQQKALEAQAKTQEDKQRDFYYRTRLLQGQVSRNAAMNIGGFNGGLMTRSTAQAELKKMLAHPDYAAGKALEEKDKAAALAVQQQDALKTKDLTEAAPVIPGL